MENITLGQISAAVLFLVALLGGLIALFKYLKNWLKDMLKEEFVEMRADINEIGVSNCKNFLVSCFAKIEKGDQLDETELERFYEEYDVYTNKYHKNSYIHSKYEKLMKEGKL